MKVILILYLFLEFCCLNQAYAKSNIDCAAHMTAFSPTIETGCCGDDLSGSKQIVSRETALNQYPWTVIIEYIRKTSGTRDGLCGGALISGRYVLTSAHCITGPVLNIAEPTTVRLGDYNKTNDGPDCIFGPDVEDCTEGETRIQIDRTIPHPEYKIKEISRANDIGLIRLKETAPYTDFIRPICLPTEDVTLKTGPINFIFAGWGTSYGPSPVKLHLDLPLFPKDQCQTAFSPSNLRLEKGQLCAGGVKGKDSCKGDGGMPLIYETNGKYVVAGIVNFGLSSCGTEHIPSVYTNIYQYSTWIRSNINP